MKIGRKVLYGPLLLGAAAILIAVAHHYQLKAAEDRYRAELQTRGEPMDLAQALPPGVPPEENSAGQFLEACALMEKSDTFLSTNPISGKMSVAPGKAMVVATQPDVRETGEFGSTNSWAEAQAAVDQNGKCLELLRGVIDKPKLDFSIPYAKGFLDEGFFTNEHLAAFKKTALLLASAAIVDLHQHNTGAAITNARVELVLANAMQDQRLLISELVRIAIANIAQSATWEILQSQSAADSDLAALQGDWERLNFTHSYANALAIERLVDDNMLAQWRKSDAELEKYLGLPSKALQSLGMADVEASGVFKRVKLSAQIFMWRYWWSYADELCNLHGRQVLLDAAHRVETNAAFAPTLRLQEEGLAVLHLQSSSDQLPNPFSLLAEPNLHSMQSESVVELSACLKKVMMAETMKRLSVAAIALKRFQLRHGNYPEALGQLVPEFLSAVPLDPVDDQPLRYRRNADGTFVLYSVGPNNKDDGGDPSLEKGAESSSYNWLDRHALDWVWPQPATEAEIKKYFEERAKQAK